MPNGITRSYKGVADMSPIRVGSPSTSSGKAMMGAFGFLLQAVRWGINYFGWKYQTPKIHEDLRLLALRVKKDQEKNPNMGVLISLRFMVLVASCEAAGSGNSHRYAGYLYGKGVNIAEARRDQSRYATLSVGTRSNERYAYLPLWYPPKISPHSVNLTRPFSVIGHACFVKNKARLQNVTWTTIQGFDDAGETSLPGSGNSYYFDILKPPEHIVTTHGGTGLIKLPIVRRMVGEGGKSIQVIDLDTFLGHAVTAVMVFPADEHTLAVFKKTRATEQKPIGTIRGIVNMDYIRWVRPENIRLLKSPGDAYLP